MDWLDKTGGGEKIKIYFLLVIRKIQLLKPNAFIHNFDAPR